MFYPREMTEVQIIVPARDVLAITKVLSGRGVFHQAESNFLSSEIDPGTQNPWPEKAAGYAALERRIQAILQILHLEEGQPTSAAFETLVDLDVQRQVIEQIETDVKKVGEQLSHETKSLENLESARRQLESLAQIDLDLSALHSTRYLFNVLGTIPVENMERLQDSLDRVPHIFLPLLRDNKSAVVWLAGARSNADILERAARSSYLNPLSLPEGYVGKPSEIIKTIDQNIQAVRKNIADLQGELKKLAGIHKSTLLKLVWDVRSSRLMTDAVVRYGRLKYTFLVVGWVPSSSLDELSSNIKKVSPEALIERFPIKREGHIQDVPVALADIPVLRPFQMLVTTYARPRYNEIDPTILIAITFPLLFGAMFGDVGQGLTLAALGWLLTSKKVKALQSMASLGGLITACGFSATIFGFLYGSIFGFEHVLPALWLHPMEHIMQVLGIAIGTGVVLLSLGFFLAMYNSWLARDWGHLFFDHNGLAGLVLYWSLLGLAGGAFLGALPIPNVVFYVLAAISGFVVMISEVLKHYVEGHRPLIEGGIGTYGIQAFFELFETFIGFLSNSLSYVRVGAFAVAHAGLSAVIFILAEMASPTKGIGYWIVVVIGNLFIIGFEGLIVGIQTMRLEYYEFFSKFFTGGGARFNPLNIRPAVEEK